MWVHCIVEIEALSFKLRNCWIQLLVYLVQSNFVKSILCKMFTAMSFAMQYWMCTVQVIVHPVQKVQCGSATVHLCNGATVHLCNCANAMRRHITRPKKYRQSLLSPSLDHDGHDDYCWPHDDGGKGDCESNIKGQLGKFIVHVIKVRLIFR